MQRNPRTSIRIRLALSIGLVTVAAALILAWIAGSMAREKIEEEQGHLLQALARRAMETLDQGMFERYREVQILAELHDLRDPHASIDGKRALLERVQSTHGHHAWIGLAGRDGIAQVGTQGYLEGRNISARPWFKNGLAGPYVGDVHDALLLAKMLPNPSGEQIYLLDVAAPVRSLDGRVAGVLCSHLQWRWTRDTLQSAIPPGVEALLLTRDYLVLQGPGFPMFEPLQGQAPGIEQTLRGQATGFYLADWGGDKLYLTAHVTSTGYQGYPGLGWRLVLRQDARVAFATAQALQNRIVFIGVGLGLLFAALGWLISYRLTRPIEILADAAERIDARHLDGTLPALGGRDELARLSGSLGRMLAALKGEIGTRRAAEERLRLAATVFESSVEGIVICDAQNRIVSVNRAFSEITGYAPDETIGRGPSLLSSGRHDREFYRDMWQVLSAQGAWRGEIWNRRKNGEVYPEWLSISAVRDESGALSHYVGVFSDITERKRSEDSIRFLANHDPLTRLPNRNLFNDRTAQALARAQRGAKTMAVLFLDLDRFKDVNDTLGHMVGDELLCAMAERLRACLRPEDTLARQGGDEFIALVEGMSDSSHLVPVLGRMLQACADPVVLGEHSVRVTASIGVAVYPEDGADIDTLIKHADIALYRAKEVGRNRYQFYTAALNQRIVMRVEMVERLRRALADRQFELHYQPQVDVATGRIVGAEALLRLRNSAGGLTSPVEFIALAEETGLIVPMGDWVLHEAVRQAAGWAAAGYPVRVAVNVSGKQLQQPGWARYVQDALVQASLASSLLEIELTESVLLAADATERGNLEALIDLGLELSLDDFGTGYSSLAYLHHLKVTALKIDRSFIQALDQDDGKMLTETIISMAHNLHLKTVAEGVETARQLEILRQMGCNCYQGYHFSRPLPAAEFERLLVQASQGVA